MSDLFDLQCERSKPPCGVLRRYQDVAAGVAPNRAYRYFVFYGLQREQRSFFRGDVNVFSAFVFSTAGGTFLLNACRGPNRAVVVDLGRGPQAAGILDGFLFNRTFISTGGLLRRVVAFYVGFVDCFRVVPFNGEIVDQLSTPNERLRRPAGVLYHCGVPYQARCVDPRSFAFSRHFLCNLGHY